MRSRLLPVVLVLVVLVLLGLGVPLASSLSSSAHQQMYLDRLTLTARLASLGQRALLDGSGGELAATLDRYREVYDFTSAVVNQDGRALAQSSVPVSLQDDDVRNSVAVALSGREPLPSGTVSPWNTAPLVLAEPVLVDGEVRGAVVTVSPTDGLRSHVLLLWALVAAGGLAALALAVLLSLPLVRWILRPIDRLERAAEGMAATATAGAPYVPVAAEDSGPPELRRLARSFDEMATTVSEVLAAQRAFVADASHQLRNPLTALYVRLTSLDGTVSEEGAEDYAASVDEARRLNDVLEELLTLARTEASPVSPVPTDATAVLEDRARAWEAVAASRDIELRAEIEPGLVASAVPRAFETVMDALLDNAVKFTTGHGSTVELSAWSEGEQVVLTVRDHGLGLDPAELDRATNRFWRSPRHQNVTGSGLGLAIVHRVVARSGGTVRLDLPSGGGLRVTVEFPQLA
ncbi:signal transduction histidine kinase [Amycolatopsis bartoniae]|uniref:histidine kinase n=1 Tax=Amycolatopsis bartoniae TaxID=941986 RepID=A0A8H9MEE0_9PSEU|nr:HAMP domain-containing sensor histidine kinase [Amycolatopsis bartoniae]MBB2935660.1 signal transduction histidine kinase [Amycolatopsis bartoniae]TVT02327.1 HAMP domain-containing histidine kinase [Amycolatopsis bartoniae]GHF60921.1 two-component sensor histidine kinase [Amycolatopsis bartoniae]